jgi:hypothetical protein
LGGFEVVIFGGRLSRYPIVRRYGPFFSFTIHRAAIATEKVTIRKRAM